MPQCLNPQCLQINPDTFLFCHKCGSKLLLKERYTPQLILGTGGFGRTFLAIDEDKPSKPYCVIKQFLPQAQGTDTIEKAAQLFAQEAQRLEELGKHRQIPELMAYFTADNRQYLVQEFVEGATLQAELDQNGVFSETQVRGLLIELLKILDFVHSRGIIHRDIKPENIIRRRSNQQLFLVDFGAAKVVQPQQGTATGTIIGSAGYCAPEQSLGKSLFISDLYSLGVTCMYLLTGVSPLNLYDPINAKWAWRNFLNGKIVSDELGEILEKLANPVPKQRYQSVAEVVNVLSPSVTLNTVYACKKTLVPQPFPVLEMLEKGELKSAVGTDYRHLRDLLIACNWKEADNETRRVMLAVVKQTHKCWLDSENTNKFPCEDLRIIDQLWLKYSNGRFGFSVQQRIYKSLGGTKHCNSTIWESFGERVGWKKDNNWLGWENIIFDIQAPEGHLPLGVVGSWSIGNVGGGWVGHLLSRFDSCGLCIPQLITPYPQTTLTGHSGWIDSVAFSRDGGTLLSGGWDKIIKLWDVTTGQEIASLKGHVDCVHSVALSPDGKTLASGSSDKTIKLWDVTTRQEIASLCGALNSSVAFSPDCSTLASGIYHIIKLWDVITGQEIATLKGHSNWVRSVAFSPDGKTLASGSEDNTVKLWDVANQRQIASLIGHGSYVYSVAFSPHGKRLASSSGDKTIKIWHLT